MLLLKSFLEEAFSFSVYEDETTKAVAKYVSIILYLGVLLGFSFVLNFYIGNNWPNLIITSFLTVICACSLLLLRAGRLSDSVLTPALCTVSGVMISVTFGLGLSDPGILLLFPLLGSLTIFLDKFKLIFLGGVLVLWIFFVAALTSNGYYDGRTMAIEPMSMAWIISMILLFSLALYRLTYKQVLVINHNLESAKSAAEDANKSKSNFLATMSHELRTPLNAVIGYSDAIIEEVMEDGHFVDDHVEDLERIKRSGQDLLHMINGILDLSKIEENKMKVHASQFSVSDICQEAISIVKPMANQNQNQIVFTNNLRFGSFQITSDQIKVRQIIINLLSNAAKYTENGRIEIEVSNRKFDPHKTIFKVIDNGVGIPEDKLPVIFEAFQQVDGSLSRTFTGTGLGLAISKKLTELLGGNLSVTSDLGTGSTFTLELPNLINVPTQLTVEEFSYEYTG